MKKSTKKLLTNLLINLLVAGLMFAGIVSILWLKTIIPWQFAAAVLFVTFSMIFGLAFLIF